MGKCLDMGGGVGGGLKTGISGCGRCWTDAAGRLSWKDVAAADMVGYNGESGLGIVDSSGLVAQPGCKTTGVSPLENRSAVITGMSPSSLGITDTERWLL